MSEGGRRKLHRNRSRSHKQQIDTKTQQISGNHTQGGKEESEKEISRQHCMEGNIVLW